MCVCVHAHAFPSLFLMYQFVVVSCDYLTVIFIMCTAVSVIIVCWPFLLLTFMIMLTWLPSGCILGLSFVFCVLACLYAVL